MRIVSTVPSQTELLSYLGLDEHLVGITKFCVHPEHIYRSVERIGGTKDLDVERIIALQPDLIIANKEENERTQIEALQPHAEVYVSDVHDLRSALDMIRNVGELCDRAEESKQLSRDIDAAFAQLTPSKNLGTALYLIWKSPYMSVGRDTFIHAMLEQIGCRNMLAEQTRYPEIGAGEGDPDLILLSSEPYPFKEKHIAELQQAWPQAKVVLVDGEYFSWYGSRLLQAPAYFQVLGSQLSA